MTQIDKAPKKQTPIDAKLTAEPRPFEPDRKRGRKGYKLATIGQDAGRRKGKRKAKGRLAGVREDIDWFNEDAPINTASGGAIKGMGKPPEDGPPVKKRKKFAGADVFEVTAEEYSKCLYGRNRNERWSHKLNMDEITNQEIRTYAHRYPTKDIIVQNEITGEMSYLVRR